MTIEWTFFLSELMQNPILLVVTLLNIGVIIVNGATDAPNAIATAVSTRAMKPRHAIIMAAVFNFLGLLLVSLVSTAVAHTIFSMVDFGGNSHQALTALMAGDGRHHRLGRGGLVVRYSHLAIPLGSLPASPARPSPFRVAWTPSTAPSG